MVPFPVKYGTIYGKRGSMTRKFDYSKLANTSYNVRIINLLTSIHEAKGRQEQYLSQEPEELQRLVEIAKVQSVESSNAIEGIRTSSTRIGQLVKEKTTPKNRDEEEIAGYRDALNLIHESFDVIPLKVNYILQLHRILFAHVRNASHAGKFNTAENFIQGTKGSGESFIIFKPLAPYETPLAMENLCEAYNQALADGKVDPLLLIPVFIHDFLCIHPFLDGNGRMSRLLTALLLYRSGYFVGRYISLEAKINSIKDLYYDALQESQEGWHEGKEDPSPFIQFSLSILNMAYMDFEKRRDLVLGKKTAIDMVLAVINDKMGRIRKKDLEEVCPSLSSSSIEKALQALVARGLLTKHEAGRSTYYLKTEK